MTGAGLDPYENASDALIAKYEAIIPAELYAPVAAYLPAPPAHILDVGAGTGRDAAWLSGLGHPVTAVEPATALRHAGQQRHAGVNPWVNDSLPHLHKITAQTQKFDCVLLTAVWHHLTQDQQQTSMRTLAGLLAKGGHLIFSIRHDGSSDRVADTRHAVTSGANAGLVPITQIRARSAQADNHKAGVLWTWAVFGTAT